MSAPWKTGRWGSNITDQGRHECRLHARATHTLKQVVRQPDGSKRAEITGIVRKCTRCGTSWTDPV